MGSEMCIRDRFQYASTDGTTSTNHMDTSSHERMLRFNIDGTKTTFANNTLTFSAESPSVTMADSGYVDSSNVGKYIQWSGVRWASADVWDASADTGNPFAYWAAANIWPDIVGADGTTTMTNGRWDAQPDFNLRFAFPDATLYQVSVYPATIGWDAAAGHTESAGGVRTHIAWSLKTVVELDNTPAGVTVSNGTALAFDSIQSDGAYWGRSARVVGTSNGQPSAAALVSFDWLPYPNAVLAVPGSGEVLYGGASKVGRTITLDGTLDQYGKIDEPFEAFRKASKGSSILPY